MVLAVNVEDLFALHAHNSGKDTLGETCGYWLEHVIIRGRGLRDFKGLVSYLPVPIDSIVGIQKSQVVSICWGASKRAQADQASSRSQLGQQVALGRRADIPRTMTSYSSSMVIDWVLVGAIYDYMIKIKQIYEKKRDEKRKRKRETFDSFKYF